MRVSKTIETPNGGVTFDGELNPQELDLIISVGLNHLLIVGALPMQVMKEGDISSRVSGSEVKQ